jgi:hypothetical protein
MNDTVQPVLPGMPAPQRVCGVPGCETKINRDNQLGFCGAHRTRKSRTGPRFCSIEECGQPLHYKTESGFCAVHAPTHTPAAIKRESGRIAEKAARQSTWQVCTADGCTKRLRPHNKSGRCFDHKYVPVSVADRGQCPIEGCGRRLSKRNTVGRCEEHKLPRWVAAECAAEGCTKKLNVTNLIGFCGEHTNGYRRTVSLQRNYGITEAGYDAMLAAQGGVCAVCGQPPKPEGVRAASRLHVDHDHACCPGVKSCGKCIRALLCLTCNHGLGNFYDDPALLRRAADYLERYAAVPAA